MTREEIIKKESDKWTKQQHKKRQRLAEQQEKERIEWKKTHCTSKEEYASYLLNKKWISRRNYILNLRGHNCMKCNSTIKLHVHHLKYTGKYPWEAPDEDLICLCENCHKLIHEESEFKSKDGYNLINDFNNKEDNKNIVLCFKKNEFIGEFNISELNDKFLLKEKLVIKCCEGLTKTCGGYTWKYKKYNNYEYRTN